ncbi:MAG TPA: tyrosine-type recombinase/integrase [Candidatus Avalokitesvara rifleensis]|uniref:tyrosine-type recombinase/integrase n=1 Tax=Candidatus Avalokitesvara rifleensis TaxID=3367620 RepID=UPI002713EA27|nr:tyrosine-type recombinase/integrase [Candidatus Brocadiales bacterium]
MGVYCKEGKDGKSRWYIEYRVGGKKVRECVGASKKVAENALAVRKAEILQGRYELKKEIKSPLFEDFAGEYLEYSRANKRSYERDVSIIKALMPHFKKCRLSKITPFMVEKYKLARTKEVTRNTINRELDTFGHIFTMAIKWNKSSRNPVKEVKSYKVENRKERILTLEEIERLLACSNGHTRNIIILALNTGMRLREMLNIKWEDVNLIQGHITLRNTKNGRTRIVPMNQSVKNVIQSIEKTENAYVFYDRRTGKPFNHIRTSFAKVLKKASISGFRFHDLRHTAATYMVLGGADLATVKEILGHSTIDMTMRYSHPTPESKLKAVNTLGIFRTKDAQVEGHLKTLTTHEALESAHFLPTWEKVGHTQIVASPCQ